MTTIEVLIPLLTWLGSTVGAGAIAFALFGWLRDHYPATSGGGVLATLLWAPRYARFSVLVLAALISVCATGLLAVLTGGDVLSAIDAAFAAALSAILSQVFHASAVLSPEVQR